MNFSAHYIDHSSIKYYIFKDPVIQAWEPKRISHAASAERSTVNGYAVMLTIGRRLVYVRRFGHDEVKEAVSHYYLLAEGEMGREVEVTFTNDLDLLDVLLTQTAELDSNPLVR